MEIYKRKEITAGVFMDLKSLKKEFISLYGGCEDDIRIFSSPGRVNLIGEHTDYNGGLVFPAALEMCTTIAVRKRNDNKVRLKATDLDVLVEADISSLDSYKGIGWGEYQIGVMHILSEAGYDIEALDMLYDDTVPHGSGLSSSAAIEVSTALTFATLSNEKNGIDKECDMVSLALLSQKAEHEYAGVKCGIMDQFASAMGKKDHAILLDCNTLSYEYVPLSLGDYRIVITNTNKKHSLGASKYNERRSECEKALEILKTALPQKDCLCAFTPDEFEKYAHLLEDEIVRKRAKHAIFENDRVKKAVEVLKNGDLVSFGALMNLSHDSLKDDYEVSCFELDTLVCEARKIDGVLGSRMTGAGFGGCTVSIVHKDKVDEFKEKVSKNYAEKTGLKCDIYVTEAGDGAREIK